ncbi:helix-turn-helix transcriptional regulator [Enterococcus montenegrensis]|uniref:helix-turn-helix domain-containing protein n=1 Tax=Enterococcus montenegrensis TaxID=3031993 RepID=UPI00249DD1BD|nr:helix-turn-helix transcriptional regulator [Enterococcus montenegrensis]WHA10368.1 helix-turn-helix transcriptional regulator [Enterococcus montenegrensis]
MTFGERLKSLRNKRSLTQSQLGEKLNVTKASISGYENDTRSPDKDTLVKIAKIFGVTTDYLLGIDESQDDPNLLVAAHIDDDVSEQDMEDILRYIEYRKNNPLPKK